MLHYETIDKGTLDLLKHLQSSAIFSEARLVGGTALALQLGHRKSVDLDLFGHINLVDEELSELYSSIGHTKILSTSKNIKAFMVNGVKVDTVNYGFKWLDDEIQIDGIRLASLRDIAAMKIAAIVNRGTKKDFIDIYYLLEHFSINDMLDLYCEKYPEGSLFIVLKSLTYFDDAESDPMPYMFYDISWEEIKQSISDVILSLAL